MFHDDCKLLYKNVVFFQNLSETGNNRRKKFVRLTYFNYPTHTFVPTSILYSSHISMCKYTTHRKNEKKKRKIDIYPLVKEEGEFYSLLSKKY